MTASTSTLSRQQQRVLTQMGVDIWVRRSSVAIGATAAAGGAATTPAALVARLAPVAAVAQSLQAAPGPNVALDCLTAPGVVLVAELQDPLDRRIAQDIVRALAGAAAPLQRAAFRWPLTRTGDSRITAARNAYRGFLRGQTERATAHWLLLLGTAATALLEGDADVDASAVTEVRTLRLAGASALRTDPVAKQRLWLSVLQNDLP